MERASINANLYQEVRPPLPFSLSHLRGLFVADYSIEKASTPISTRHSSSAVTRLLRMFVTRFIVLSKIRSSMRLYGERVRDMFRSVWDWDTMFVMRT